MLTTGDYTPLLGRKVKIGFDSTADSATIIGWRFLHCGTPVVHVVRKSYGQTMEMHVDSLYLEPEDD